MVTFLLSQFASITIAYFQYSTVIKIDLIQQDTKINYYTVLEADYWKSVFWTFLPRNKISKEEFHLFGEQLKLKKTNNEFIDKLLIASMYLNLTHEFYNANPFFDNPQNLYVRNHIHQGYIIKEIFTNTRMTKFWTYKLNRSIKKRIKVICQLKEGYIVERSS